MKPDACLREPIASWELPKGELVRLHKARENYLCANCAFGNGFVNVAASRFYYAMILASVELLEKKGIKPDPNPRFARGKDPFRLEVIGTARAEMDNAAQLIELLESTDVPIFATTDDPNDEDSFTFGPNLAETLRMKIKIMRAHWLDYDRIFTRP